jgi:gliding motility-associated-like protein
MIKRLLFLISATLPLFALSQAPTLVINEVSNGSTGAKEYFEFLVIGPKAQPCQPPQTLDLRNWIFDDNNGILGSGSNKGIATGAFRFKNIAFWSAVPVGTLILIYNSDDYESSLITNDNSLTDGNCTLVLPCTSNLLESQSTSPTTSSSSYPSGGWVTPTDWTPIGLRNQGDGVLIFKPNSSTPEHSLGYGDVTIANASIKFSATGSNKVYSMKNSSSDNFFSQSNWAEETASNTTQTPGKPNNSANEAYILSLSNGCQVNPTTPPVVFANVIPTTCGKANGTLQASVTGGTQPVTFQWSNSAQGATVNNVSAGYYQVIATDAAGCKDTFELQMPSSTALTTTTSSAPDSCNLGIGSAKVNVNTGTAPYSYQWSNSNATNQLTNVVAGTYQVTVTDAANCTSTSSVTVSLTACGNTPSPTTPIDSLVVLEMPTVFTPNGDGANDLYVPVSEHGIQLKSFVILNRWGNVMHETSSSISWDGKQGNQEATPGVYFYTVRYKTIFEDDQIIHGFFHLVR